MVQLSLTSAPDSSPNGRTTLLLSEGIEMSWDDLYSELSPALVAYARSRGVRDPEDLAQEVFADAYRYRDSFSGDRAQLRSLLFTIAYRRICDFHRRRSRSLETLVPGPQEVDVVSTESSPTEDQVVFAETADIALQALSILSHREQVVIRMRVIEELSCALVSQRLGLSNANVRVIQARALSKVRAFLVTPGRLRHPLGVAMLLGSLRYTGSRLPAKGRIGGWIRDLKTSSANPRRAIPEPHPQSGVHEVVDTLCASASSLVTQVGTVVSRVALGVVLVTGFGLAWVPQSTFNARADAALGEPTSQEAITTQANGSRTVDPEFRLSGGKGEQGNPSGDPAEKIPLVASLSPAGHSGILDRGDGLVTSTFPGATDMLLETTSSLLAATPGVVSSTLSSAAGTAEGLLETTVAAVSSTIGTAEDLTEAVGGAVPADLSNEAVSTVAGTIESSVEEAGETVRRASGASDGIVDEVDTVTDLVDEEVVDPSTSLLGG